MARNKYRLQSWSQLICSGQAKIWAGLQLTKMPWYSILANSMESRDTYHVIIIKAIARKLTIINFRQYSYIPMQLNIKIN